MGNTLCVSERKDTEWSVVSDNECEDEVVVDQDQKEKKNWLQIPTLMRNARSQSDLGMQTCDLHIDQKHVDPTKGSVKSQLLSKLGLPSSLKVETLSTDQDGTKVAHGFNNTGLWTVTGTSQASRELVVKLVRADLGEKKKYEHLESEFPEIASDPLLAFPSHIFRCITRGDEQPPELIVMRKACGKVLHDFVVTKVREDRRRNLPTILALFRKVGACLADFHTRYRNKQHSDFQPTNIIYDEMSEKITFIDIANMGCHLNKPGSDVQQFRASIKALYTHLDSSLAEAFEQSFVSGYNKKH